MHPVFGILIAQSHPEEIVMEQTVFSAAGRTLRLHADAPDAPLVVLPCFGDEADVMAKAFGDVRANLLFVNVPDWERDLTPWACPPLRKGGAPFPGEADAFLAELTDELLPAAKRRIGGTPCFTAIAGYSLAGLFALYALYRCDCFGRAASVSGSLWYPNFAAFCRTHTPPRKPDRLYLSLGDREAAARHPLMRTVGEATVSLARHFADSGIPTEFEWNQGNHFTDPEGRLQKALAFLLAP